MSLLDGLVSWWDLDEQSGTRLDAHGLHDATDVGGVGFVTGKHGNAASMTSTKQLLIADHPDLRADGASGWTYAQWMYRATSGGGSNERYASKFGSGGNEWIVRSSLEFICYKTGGSTDVRFVVSPGLQAGWNFFAVGRNPVTSEAFIYLNGVYTAQGGATSGNGGTSALAINGDADGKYRTTQDADEAAFWQRALSVAELDELWNGGAGLSYADLIGGTPEPVTVSADYTPIPVTSYGAWIVQGQQVTADYTQVPIESYGAGVVISPVEIGASFDQIPVTSYGAGVEIIPVEVGASYTEVSVTSYGADVEIGSTGIGATYTEVPVYSFDASITQGRIVSAAYDEIAVTTYDAAVIPGAIGIGADYTLIPVESYSAGITQGVGIGAEYTEIPVTSFAASIIQGLRIGVTYTEVPVTSYSAEIVDGSIIRPNRMDCSVRPYYQITASVRPYYDITATVRPYYDITATVNPAIQ